MTGAPNLAYVFDEQNRLRAIAQTSGDATQYSYDASGYRVRSVLDGVETYYLRDDDGSVLSEFRRAVGATHDPEWDKDYIYAFGQVISLIKNTSPAPPARPRTFSKSTQGGVTDLTFVWDAVEENDIDHYKVFRNYTYTDNSTSPLDVTGLNVSTTQYTETLDSTIQKAAYTVKAVDTATNQSAHSAALVVVPNGPAPSAPPGNVQATALDQAVRVSWTPITTATDEDIAGYLVKRKDPPGTGVWEPWATIEGPEIGEYLDFPLQNGTLYEYRVLAMDTSQRYSGPSPTVSATPRDSIPPAKPVGVGAGPTEDVGRVRVYWLPVTDPDLAGYNVYRSLTPGGQSDLDVSGTVPKIATEFVDMSASQGQTYYYTVKGFDTSLNLSPASVEVSARPRHDGVGAPVLAANDFEVEQVGAAPTGFHNWTAEDDDKIQVPLTWDEVGGALNYRVYRAEGDSTFFTHIGNSTATTPLQYEDGEGNGHDYTYYVVATFMNGSVEEEGPASNTHRAVDEWEDTNNVRAVYLEDGSADFTTYNSESRRVRVHWSRVLERQLQGYHVYRRCEWDHQCPQSFTTDALTCEPVWVRVTESMVSDDDRSFIDDTVGGLHGCYVYGVRPVGPDRLEGNMTRAVWIYTFPGEPHTSSYQNNGVDNLNPDTFSGDPNNYLLFRPMADEFSRINAIEKGTEQEGPPNPPLFPSLTWHQVTFQGPQHRPSRAALLRWTLQPNLERDLAGYHVEMAGSAQGPWKRVTQNPVAWWESQYTARGLGVLGPGSSSQFSGHTDCIHFRLIAVDDAGNESNPTAPVGYQPCAPGPTPAIPTDLRAETGPPQGTSCTTRLTWDPSEGAQEYYVYRFVLFLGQYFYNTQMLPAKVCSGDMTTACADDSTCVPGTCVDNNSYVEAGDPNEYGGTFNTYCPYWDGQLSTCDTGLLEAYYVTARHADSGGLISGESPPSNVVFWDCDEPDGGYARLKRREWFEERWHDDGPAYASLVGPPEVDEVLACFDEGGDVRGKVYTPESVVGGVIAVPEASSVVEARAEPAELSSAELVTLGQGEIETPEWFILDLHTDHLGSVRLITNDEGAKVSRHKYLPFGEEVFTWEYLPDDVGYNTHVFTGHERDGETGLDYMMARYYGDDLPRFLSPDSGESWDEFAPQSWNLYSYVQNNPLMFFDPNGEEMRYIGEMTIWDKSMREIGWRGGQGGGFLRFDINGTAERVDLNSLSIDDIIVDVVDSVDIAEGQQIDDTIIGHEFKHVAAFQEAFKKLGLDDLDKQLQEDARKVVEKGRRKGWSEQRIRTEIKARWIIRMARVDTMLKKKQGPKHKKIDKKEKHKKEYQDPYWWITPCHVCW